jgi:hypothetical protein
MGSICSTRRIMNEKAIKRAADGGGIGSRFQIEYHWPTARERERSAGLYYLCGLCDLSVRRYRFPHAKDAKDAKDRGTRYLRQACRAAAMSALASWIVCGVRANGAKSRQPSGSALGSRGRTHATALKGQDSDVCRPFRAGVIAWWWRVPRALPLG